MAPAAENPGLASISSGLTPGADGIWYSAGHSAVSFTEGGHEECLRVEDSSFWFRHRNQCILELISLYPPLSGRSVFDVGGGNGCVSNFLREHGFGVVLVEPGLAGAQSARARGIEHIVCGTMEEAGFRSGSLGAVGIFDVLEHVEDDRDFLGMLHDVLEPRGRLYVTVPAYPKLWSFEDIYAGHYRRYTIGTLVDALESSEFKVDFASHFFRWLPIPIFLLRSIPYRLGLGRDTAYSSDTCSDHAVDRQWVSRVMTALSSGEVTKIKNGSRVGFGGSILVAASAV